MKKNNKVCGLLIATLIIMGNLSPVSAAPATNQKQIKCDTLVSAHHDKGNLKGKCRCNRGPMIKEGVEQLQKEGTLSENDVKNIDTFMKKERAEMQSQMKEKIYKNECAKIDKMVSEKVISKDQGDKLKVVIKENVENYK